jgi:hypothetical protein
MWGKGIELQGGCWRCWGRRSKGKGVEMCMRNRLIRFGMETY